MHVCLAFRQPAASIHSFATILFSTHISKFAAQYRALVWRPSLQTGNRQQNEGLITNRLKSLSHYLVDKHAYFFFPKWCWLFDHGDLETKRMSLGLSSCWALRALREIVGNPISGTNNNTTMKHGRLWGFEKLTVIILNVQQKVSSSYHYDQPYAQVLLLGLSANKMCALYTCSPWWCC